MKSREQISLECETEEVERQLIAGGFRPWDAAIKAVQIVRHRCRDKVAEMDITDDVRRAIIGRGSS